MEIGITMNPWKGFFGNINYTWLSAEDKEDGHSKKKDAEFTPEHKINLDAGYLTDFGLGLFLQASYTADQIEYYKENNREKVRDLPDFLLLNAKISYKPPHVEKIGMELFAEAKNLTDKDYDEGSGAMPGRSFLAGITLSY